MKSAGLSCGCVDTVGEIAHLTRMPAAVLERLWHEDGEVGIVTDR